MTKDERVFFIKKRIDKLASELEANIDQVEGKHEYMYAIVGKSWDIFFEITNKERLSIPVNTLYCMVRIGKNDKIYMLHEILDVIVPDDCEATIFPYVIDENRANLAMDVLEEKILRIMPEIKSLLNNHDVMNKLDENRKEDFARLFKMSKEEYEELDDIQRSMYLDFYVDNCVCRVCRTFSYKHYSKGNFKKALKKYESNVKKNKCLLFEEKIYRHLESGINNKPYPEGYEYIESIDTSPVQMIKLMVVPFFFWLIVILVLHFTIDMILSRGTIYYEGLEVWFDIIMSLLFALLTGIQSRKLQFKFRKDKTAYNLERARESKKENRIINIISSIMIVAILGIWFSLCIAATRVYDTYIIYDEMPGIFTHKYQRFEYSDIETIYYKKGLYNVYDEYIERGSYVFYLKNGKQIDTDGFLSKPEVIIEAAEIDKKNVIVVNSERDIDE